MIKPVDNDLLEFFAHIRGIAINIGSIERLLSSKQNDLEDVEERLDKLEKLVQIKTGLVLSKWQLEDERSLHTTHEGRGNNGEA